MGYRRCAPRDFQQRVLDLLEVHGEALTMHTELLVSIKRKVNEVSDDQQQADAVAAEIEADVATEASDLDAIKTEIANLQSQHPQVDFTALNQAVSDLDAGKAAEDAVANPADMTTASSTNSTNTAP